MRRITSKLERRMTTFQKLVLLGLAAILYRLVYSGRAVVCDRRQEHRELIKVLQGEAERV